MSSYDFDIYNFGLRRACARAIDNAALFAVVYVSNPAATSNPNNKSIFIFFLMATVIDCLCTYMFGRGLGKLLLGIRVKPDGGQDMDLQTAIRRSFCIWLFGYALGVMALATIAQFISIAYYLRNDRTIWDDWTNTSVISVQID